MSAGRYDLKIEQGANFRRVITVKDSTGAVIDFTGQTIRAMIRQTYGAAAALVSITCALDVDKNIILTLTPVQTAALVANMLPSCPYYWDLEVSASVSQVSRLLMGEVRVSPEATK